MIGAEVTAVIYVRQPTDEERQELKRMTRQAVGRVAQRAQMILLSSQGRSVPEIAAFTGMSRARVRHWMERFDSLGPDGLYDAPRSGRPRKLTAGVEASLWGLVSTDPLHSGYLMTLWTVAMLTGVLLSTLGVDLCPSTVRAGLHRLGLHWGRPRLGMPRKTDPEKARKQWRIVEAVFEAGPQATILYADESRVQLLPLIRAMWHWVGQQVRVPTPGSNDTRTVFGALNIRTGTWTYLVRKSMHKEDFIAFLEHLLVGYPEGSLILIVDNYSSHTAGEVRRWLVKHPRLQLHYLPTHCSHLNPVEAIWRQLKNQLAANRLYGSMPLLLETVDQFFNEMSPEQALKWADAA